MFGFLRRLFRRKTQIEGLRARWEARKAPGTAEELAHALLENDKLPEALAVLKEAYRLFPRSDRIRAYYYHTLGRRSSQELIELRRKLACEERPALYARLAELYRYLGRFEEALEVAQRGIEKFPNFSGNYLAAGRIHYTRFVKTASCRDGRRAAESLSRAWELDPHHRRCLFHLATLHLTVGDRDSAQRYLEALGKLIPGDVRLSELWERLRALPSTTESTAVDYWSRYEAEQLARREAPPSLQLRSRGELEPLAEDIASVRGVRFVQVLDSAAATVLALPEGHAQNPYGEVVPSFFDAARINCRRMSIGSFCSGVAALNDMTIFLRDLEGNGIAVCADPDVRTDQVQQKLDAFAEACFCEAERT